MGSKWDTTILSRRKKGIEKSLEHAAFAYISFLWERKETLKVIHPWLKDAYWQLKEIVE